MNGVVSWFWVLDASLINEYPNAGEENFKGEEPKNAEPTAEVGKAF